jgi:hypothetical protein
MVTVPAPDQCPDKPRNGPGSAWACAEISNIVDANSAALRQFAERFKKKRAMNPPSKPAGLIVTKPRPFLGVRMLLTVNRVRERRRLTAGKLTLACPPDHAIARYRFNADVFGLVARCEPGIRSYRCGDATLPVDWTSPTPKMVADSKETAAPERAILTKARFHRCDKAASRRRHVEPVVATA